MAIESKRYAGKAALVTAGASGIGLATVERLAWEGASVAICDIALERGREEQRRLADAGLDVFFIEADAAEEAAVERMVAEVVRRCGRLDVAINNAGGHGPDDRPGTPLHEGSFEGWRATVRWSLDSTFLCMKHEIAAMLKTGGGAIANTSSMAGMRVTQYASPAYTAAKAGVIHLTEMAAILYAKQNIRISAVAPGLTGSPAISGKMAAETRATIVRDFHPMGRLIAPAAQAAAFAWLCCDDAADVTGLTIPVDGGWAAR
ncbi:MAG: SDR family oxidoreductase [Caulobacteraceae bacterium]|nr:SDR family oxidoreductase [Caulobacteraceae bacterium]